VDFLSKIFHESDFAITSNGRTVFELGSLHVPMIVIPVNARENRHTFVDKYDVGYMVQLNDNLSYKKFLKSFKNMCKFNERKKFQNNLKQINLLNGVERVVSTINTSYEHYNK
jgi:spore coat polysaccharide biosynthesis predicted glycosyltransferase SpsG